MTVTYNQETMRFSGGADKAKAQEKSRVLIPVEGQVLDKLVSYSQADGFILTRKNAKGKLVNDRGRLTSTIKLYVSQAVLDFISSRDSK